MKKIAVKSIQTKGIFSVNHYSMQQSVIAIIFKWIIVYALLLL